MGYNPTKQKMSASSSITNVTPSFRSTSVICPDKMQNLEITHIGSVGDTLYNLRRNYKTKLKRLQSNNYITNNALPIFASIVEYGKLRMQEIANFWDTYCSPGSVIICYSQCDNFIVAVNARGIDETVTNYAAYQQEKTKYINDKLPGHLKLEWQVDKPGWKFISPAPMTHCLLAGDSDVYKLNSITNVTSGAQAYKLLTTNGNIEQTRRIDKLVSTETKQIKFNVSFASSK